MGELYNISPKWLLQKMKRKEDGGWHWKMLVPPWTQHQIVLWPWKHPVLLASADPPVRWENDSFLLPKSFVRDEDGGQE